MRRSPCLPGHRPHSLIADTGHRPTEMHAKCVLQEGRHLGRSVWEGEVWRKQEWALKSARSRVGWQDGVGDVTALTPGCEWRMTCLTTTLQHLHAHTHTEDQYIRILSAELPAHKPKESLLGEA